MPLPTKVIEIKLDSDTREFTFQPTSAKVKLGQTVKWKSTDGPFVVQMKGAPSPFGNPTIKSGTQGPPYETSGDDAIGNSASPGQYHYAAAINKNGLEISSGCPDLEVS